MVEFFKLADPLKPSAFPLEALLVLSVSVNRVEAATKQVMPVT